MKKVLLSSAAVLALSGDGTRHPRRGRQPPGAGARDHQPGRGACCGRQRLRQELEGLRHPRRRGDRRPGGRRGLGRGLVLADGKDEAGPRSHPPTRPSGCSSRTSAARRTSRSRASCRGCRRTPGSTPSRPCSLYHVVPGAPITAAQAVEADGAELTTRPGRHDRGDRSRAYGQQRSRSLLRRPGSTTTGTPQVKSPGHQQGQPPDRPRHQPGAASDRPLTWPSARTGPRRRP